MLRCKVVRPILRPHGLLVLEMWRSVKSLEEQNKRLSQERDEWVAKALQLSKRLYDLQCAERAELARGAHAKMAVNSE